MWRRRAAWWMAWWMGTCGLLAQGRSQVRLWVDSSSVKPGTAFYAAVELVAPPDWHTYWRNPGDSGQPTKIEWTLPEGVTAGDILWPAPTRITEAGLTTYAYDGKVVLPVRLMVAPDRAPGPLPLQARVSWLECKTECLPGRATVSANLTVGPEAKPSPEAALIAAALAAVPEREATPRATAVWTGPATGDTRPLVVRGTAPGISDFFPLEDRDSETARQSEGTPDEGLPFMVTKTGANWPAQMSGLLVFGTRAPDRRAVKVTLPIEEPVVESAPVSATPAGETAAPIVRAPQATLAQLIPMLGLAFLGGLILNIMPCVLPVIALKILGFVKQSRENPRRVRWLGVVYTIGVLTSFAIMAAVVIGVQSTGKTASWGMQFQNPVFLVAITTLVTLVALNLFGVFEINVGSGTMTTASQLASREGSTGAFFNGVFTTVLATPCTAPFLGAALGFAFGQPPVVLLLLFLTAGLGLATPYLLLALQPAWLKFLPKPGDWMITFKTLMGFPMLATALWLLSLSMDHFGEGGVFWLGMFEVCVSLVAWIFGKYIQTGIGHRGLSWGVIGAALLASYALILESQLHWRSPAPVEAAVQRPAKKGGIAWTPWSPEAVGQARAAGHPVLVDFTAKWCWTCRLNKATAIEVPRVTARLRSLGAVTLLGDYTREDPAIANELRKWERAGVPLVLVYSKNPSLPPKVLPERLTESTMLEALNWAAQ